MGRDWPHLSRGPLAAVFLRPRRRQRRIPIVASLIHLQVISPFSAHPLF